MYGHCSSIFILLICTLPLFLGHPTIIEAQLRSSDECEGCGNECDKCKYGSAISRWCGVRECLKGPGEMCGGVRDKYGGCGDGMYCRCNKCTGCSLDTLDCYSGFCPVVDSMVSRQFRDSGHLGRSFQFLRK